MKKDFKNIYIENAVMYSTSLIKANSKKANKAADKLFEIEKKIEVEWSKLQKEEFYKELLCTGNIYVKCWVATRCLRIGIFTDIAKGILVEISENKDVDWVVSLKAKMALEVLVEHLWDGNKNT